MFGMASGLLKIPPLHNVCVFVVADLQRRLYRLARSSHSQGKRPANNSWRRDWRN